MVANRGRRLGRPRAARLSARFLLMFLLSAHIWPRDKGSASANLCCNGPRGAAPARAPLARGVARICMRPPPPLPSDDSSLPPFLSRSVIGFCTRRHTSLMHAACRLYARSLLDEPPARALSATLLPAAAAAGMPLGAMCRPPASCPAPVMLTAVLPAPSLSLGHFALTHAFLSRHTFLHQSNPRSTHRAQISLK